MKKGFVAYLVSVLFIILFTYAALAKLLTYRLFEAQLGQSPLLLPFAKWLAWIVPSIELVISILLFVDRFRLFSLYACFGLMALFTNYIIVLMNYTYYVPCSCGGILQHMSWKMHLLFNIVFILLAISGIFALQSHRHKLFYCNKTGDSENL